MRFKFLLAAPLVLSLVGCQPKVAPTPPQAYDLNGLKVEFSPPDKWGMKRQRSGLPQVVQVKLPDGSSKTVTDKDDKWEAMVFQSPDGKSRIIVNAGAGVNELTKPLLNSFDAAIAKRKAKLTRAYYYQDVAGDKQNGFTMEYQLNEGGPLAEKGKQVHFAKKGQLISITLDDPAADYPQDIGQFDNVVSSFQIK